MSAKPGLYQPSFNAGELAGDTHGRTDVKQFYSGAALMRNCEPVPQGGFRLLPRSWHEGRVRALLDAIDGELTQDDATLSAPGVVALLDLDAAAPVEVVEISAFSAASAIADALLVELHDAAALEWVAVSAALDVGTTARTRRVALPPGQSVTADQVRVRLVVAPGGSTAFTVGGIAAFEAGAPATDAVIWPFTFSASEAYDVVIGAGHADIWRGGQFVGAAGLPYTVGEIGGLRTTQRADTMLLWLETEQPQRLMRQGADHEWSVDDVPFDPVADVDYGGDYPKVTDEWEVYLRYPTSDSTHAGGANLFLAVIVAGEETPGLDTGSSSVNWSTFAGTLQAAINALPSVGGGVTVSQASSSGLTRFTIAFGGVNDGQRFDLAARVVNTTEAAATATHSQIGDAGGEPLISEARGWPRCGTFYQDRLILGGFRSKPSAIAASVTGDYFNLNARIEAASGAIVQNLDTEGAELIEWLARGRFLMIFTSEAEYFAPDRVIDRNQPINIVECSRNGVAPNVAVVSSEGSLLYVGRNRSIVYAATYSDVAQSYDSDPLSLLASHLVDGVRGAALQKSATETDANRYFLVRDDGLLAIGIMIRGQEVTAFVGWETDGLVRRISVNGANEARVIVEREVDGQPLLFLERLSADVVLDGALAMALEPASATVTGLGIHEGATVWAEADGFMAGPYVVEDSAIQLPEPASTVTVGRWTAPRVQTLRLPRAIDDRTVVDRPANVHTVRFHVIGTTSIAVGANDEPAEDLPLYRAGDPTDAPLAPVTRELMIDGLTGWSDEGAVVVTQLRPGRLHVRDITIEAEI